MADFDLHALAREAGLRARKILPALETTMAHEADLRAIIMQSVREWRRAADGIAAQWTERDLAAALVQAILSSAETTIQASLTRVPPQVEDWTRKIERWHRKRWIGAVRGALRLDIEPILEQGDVRAIVEAATAQNVSLIRALSREAYRRMEDIVWTAYSDGSTAAQLRKRLREEMGFAPKRARLIARDQLGKFSGSLDKARQEQAGIKRYRWRTVGDDHVRPKHVANNRKVFAWSKRPAHTGHPGEDIQCRCKAQAILFTVEEEAEIRAAERQARAAATP